MSTGEAGHPLSFAQEELWLADLLREGVAATYLLSGVFRLRGTLDDAALRAALTATADRHEVLRTRFGTADGVTVQLVDAPAPVPLAVVDLVDVAPADREERIDEAATADQRVPIDLRTQAPWRVTLLRLAPNDAALLVTVHHIAFDGWSWGVLAQELSAHYAAFLTGEPAMLPELPLQYRDFAERQRQRSASPALDRQLDYWRERLAGLEPLELPTDRPRPVRWQADGDGVEVTVPAELAASLARFGRAHRATPFMTHLTAFNVLLARHTGRRDVAVGTFVAGRDKPDLERLIGLFLHTVVLRTDLSGDPSFTEALAAVRAATLESFANRDAPFARVAAAVEQQRDLSRNPVFQVGFSLQTARREPLRLPGLDVELIPSPRTSSPFDLSLHLFVNADGSMRAVFLFATALFDRVTVERLAEGYLTLLGSIAAGPELRVSRLAVLSEGERGRLAGWNDTATDLAGVVPSVFAAQVAASPDAVAVVSGQEELTYAELGERVARLAGYLRGLGVGPEARVGVALPRGAELVTALLGVLSAGGVYLPLPPEQPAERLGWIVADAAPVLILTHESLRDTLIGLPGGVPVVALDGQWAEIAAADPADPAAVDGAAAAYLIYTSGSTGRPKGVLGTHAGIANRVAWSVDRFGLGTGERVLQKTTIGFDASLWELLAPLCCGGAVVMAGPDAHRDPAVMLAEVREHAVTVLQLVPSVLRLVLDEPGLVACTSLRVVCSAGEALSITLAARLRAVLPGVELVNTYGPTEASIDATAHTIESCGITDTADVVGTAPIGRPLPNLRAYVVDAAGQLVPVGVTGELRLAGVGLARGYHGRPDLTAERFAPNPFALTPGERWYRTGDAARRRHDGAIEFRGRLDDQVKIHGVRVEPGEVEAALRAHPGIAAALVTPHQTGTGDIELTGYLVPTDTDTVLDVVAVRAHLARQLPDAMVPATLLSLDSLPLLANGKVDRAALPAPDISGRADPDAYLAPRTPTEQIIAEAMADLLGLDQVGVHDDFFTLGGHSLIAIRLMLKLRRAFGVDLTVSTLFTERTVARLAALIDTSAADVDGAGIAIVPVPRDGDVPLSFAQRRLWFLDQLDPGSVEYLLPVALRLRGRLDVAALRRAVDELAANHEVLRTRYAANAGEPVQVIDPPGPVPFTVADLRGEPDPDTAGRALLDGECARPFDLTRDHPIRVTVARTGEAEHLLAITAHHIAFDGWSTGLFLRDLDTAYRAAAAGRPSPLRPTALQYADFAAWEHGPHTEQTRTTQLDYWRERLAGLEPLELPTDRPRPTRRDPHGDSVLVPVPDDLARALTDLAAHHGATTYMTLLAAFNVLLARHTGRTDIAVGTPVAGRTRPETENLLGFFVNSLVIRTDLSGDPSFTEALAAVRAATLGAFAHQDLPFEHLVEVLRPDRDLSRNPLFQIVFDHQHEDVVSTTIGGLALEPISAGARVAKFDLLLTTVQHGDGRLRCVFNFATELFDRVTVERLAEGYLTLLGSIAAGPELRVSRLAVLSEGERGRLAGWNDTATDLAGVVPSVFAAQVAASPDAVAVVSGQEELTYAELGERVARLAGYLRGLGVGPEARVGVALPRGAELVTALLGVLSAGGVYLPLPPEQPAERLGWIVADAAPVLILTHESLRDTLIGLPGGVPVVALDGQWAEIAAADPADPAAVDGAAAAYLIYTSGSTGRPKGVLGTHAGIANRVAWSVDRFGLGTGERVLQKTTIGFDASLWELLAPLCCGGAVVMAGPDAHRDPAVMLAEVREHAVTVLQLVPSVLRLVLDEPGLVACTSLRVVCSAGEALSITLAARLRAVLPGVELVNTYGPTEASIDATAHTIESCGITDTADVVGTAPIGRPLPNLRAYVVDAAGQLVPVGVTGELRLAGVGLARGYHGRPDLTAERFAPNPFALTPGERWYRTGDAARRRHDGAIEFRGRLDDQVKIHGVRVEPGEVEAALRAHPGIAAALVTPHQTGTGDIELTGYLVPTDTDTVLDVVAVRAHLARQLPDAMVPATLLSLDSLPLLANGKVDRAALPAPDISGRADPDAYLAPRTPTEQIIAEAMADLLGLDQVGVHDDFFTLGGHSLIAIRLMLKLRRAFGVDLTVSTLFTERTVARLAALIDTSAADVDGAGIAIVPVPRDGDVPLSFAQRRLWFLDQLDPGSVEYLLPVALRLRGRLDVAALRRAVDELAANHEVLRTRYAANAGEPVQVIDPPGPVPFTVADLRGEPDPDTAGRALLDGECARPFDLTRDHPIRVTVARTGEAEHLLAITAHHIAFDGWSTGLFLRDLDTAYRAAAAGRPSPLRPTALQYADFAAWEHGPHTEQTRTTQLDYWRERLAGLEPLELPTDRPRPTRRDPHGDSVLVPVPDDLARALTDLAAHHGATTYMTLLAAFNVLLARHTGRTDIAVGTPVAGRTRPETENLLGFFVNSLVIRTDLSGDPSFTEALAAVRAATLGAFAHQDLPFEHLVEVLRPDRDLSRNPLFQIMFDHQHEDHLLPATFGGATAQQVGAGAPVAKFDLTLSTIQHGDGRLRCVFNFATELFDRVTVERLARHYLQLLSSIVADPDARLGELSLLPEDERHNVLGAWADPAGGRLELLDPPAQRNLCVPELFERQVEQAPDAVAVLAAGGQRLTYAELNAAANRLAHHLRSLGVGPEVVVGSCLERSAEAVVVLLAVLKAGGVYAPFDPRHPAERLEFMLADAGAAVIVTTREFAGRLGSGHRVVTVDGDAELIPGHEPTNPSPSAGPGNLAYVIYTSGSTGRPKGVMIEHRSYAHHCRVIADAYGIGPDDRVVLLSALTFDVAMDQIAATLLAGAAIVVSDPVFWTPADLAARLAEHAVTVMEITPAYYRELLEADASLLTGLKLMNVGSDVVTVSDVQRWAATGLPGRFLCNYGPTEATVTSMLHAVESDLAGQRPETVMPIGRPVAGTRGYVLDSSLCPVPIGAPGELCLGGIRLARGYHNQPGLTAERFVPDPFATEPGARLYRSGDLVRHRADGTIEFLGRIDQQVKIRGFRIELGEIEAGLLEHPAVRAAAVVAREHGPGDRRLVAYLVQRDDAPLDVAGLRAHLRDLLPEYMIPSYWVTLDALPLTASKKVDRKALPAPDVSVSDAGHQYQAPRNPVEETVAGIWSDVLNIARVGAHDDFFELGGHSLLATRVLARLRDTYVIDLPLRALFEATTVAALAAAVITAVEMDVAALTDTEVKELLANAE